MSAEKNIPYGRQLISNEDISSVVEALKGEMLTQGNLVAEFEEKLAAKTGAKYAVVFSSGTAALHGAYSAAGLTKGDNFITSPMTFAATANAGIYLGASPLFCDIEFESGNIDANLIEKNINNSTKLIAPVHYSGMPADMEKIRKIADKHSLFVVEDACHALGAEYKNSKIGDCKYSDMTVFSFHPVKHITTGEGGAVLTNDLDLKLRLENFRTHGIVRSGFVNEPHGGWYNEMQNLGFNYRITDIQCALGISQLSKLDDFINKRRSLAEKYDKAFAGLKGILSPPQIADRKSAYHLYPIRLERGRKFVYDFLREKNIYTQVHYIPVYMHPFYRENGFEDFSLENAEKFYQSELSIPMFPSLTDSESDYVIECVKEALECVWE